MYEVMNTRTFEKTSYNFPTLGSTIGYKQFSTELGDSDELVTIPMAVDPANCGCTECLTGQYMPLDQAEAQHIADMLAGNIANNTGQHPHVQVVFTFESGETFIYEDDVLPRTEVPD